MSKSWLTVVVVLLCGSCVRTSRDANNEVSDTGAVNDSDTVGDGEAGDAGDGEAGDGEAGDGEAGDGDNVGRYASAVLASRPIAYWRLDEATTPTAYDLSGNGNDGVYKLATLGAPGALANDANPAVELGPEKSSVELGDKFGFEGRAPFTIELWMKPSEPDGFVMGKVTFDGTWYDGWHISFNDDRLKLRRARHNFEAIGLVAGAYNHVCITFDGVNLLLYLNGERISQFVVEDDLPAVEADFVIGRMYPNQWKHYIGLLDEVALYDRALSVDEVRDHHAAAVEVP